MTSAYDIYEFYLSAEDLKGKSDTVKIESAKVKPVFDPKEMRNVNKIVIKFFNRHRLLSLNKTQAEDMIKIAGTDQIEKWVNVETMIAPVKLNKSKDTIKITAKNAGEVKDNKPPTPDDF